METDERPLGAALEAVLPGGVEVVLEPSCGGFAVRAALDAPEGLVLALYAGPLHFCTPGRPSGTHALGVVDRVIGTDPPVRPSVCIDGIVARGAPGAPLTAGALINSGESPNVAFRAQDLVAKYRAEGVWWGAAEVVTTRPVRAGEPLLARYQWAEGAPPTPCGGEPYTQSASLEASTW